MCAKYITFFYNVYSCVVFFILFLLRSDKCKIWVGFSVSPGEPFGPSYYLVFLTAHKAATNTRDLHGL